ncbi:uncharacterized protein C8orf74 homolog [Ylistrum balloti]|uniref:uncharacterized protein C8orf74 homolog n=1 Tax=Ylistrum balloti TaxID=509963 RepID=UPI002905B98A|nr:uncharacterized protein C8orf74 homolog [Ylistrum balloti]
MAAILSTTAAQHVASLSKEKGKQSLLKHLGWQPFNAELAMRHDIHLDFLYECLMFAVEKGFSWDQVCAAVDFSEQLLQESIGKSLPDTLEIFKQKSEELGFVLATRNYKVYAEYVFLTFMRQYRLFQYVFTHDRESRVPNVQLEIHTPPSSCSEALKTAKEKRIWEYNQKYEAVQQRERDCAEQRAAKREIQAAEAGKQKEQMMKKITESQEQQPLNKEKVGEIIREVLQAHTSALLDKMKNNINDMKEDLELKLEKTSIPRPANMGQPPRFNTKPKTPAVTPVRKPKSPKEDRKKSAGSSRSRSRASKS